mgnify:CR=1 FL=1|jgi:hypothetical protein
MLTVCTSTTEDQLASLGDLMVMLGVTASSSGMDLSLTQATDWAERYVGSPLRRQVYEETVAGYGSLKLMLSRTPVYKIQRFFSSTTTDEATEFKSSEYRLSDQDAGFIERDQGFRWSAKQVWNLGSYVQPNSELKPWLVVYEAGYQFPETSSTDDKWATTTTANTLPPMIERAVLLRAAEMYQGSAGVSSMKVGPLTVSYSSESQDTPEGMLNSFIRIT